ncbi:MAG: transporter associated domain-containing protein [Gammaproteobacteria bacterium]|nr:transporter associated domain-containing protein [Gammaproteobacteria bacterium]
MADSATPKTWLARLKRFFLGEPKDRKELVEILQDAQERNLFDSSALTMIEGALQVSEMQVRDIMIPRSQMVVVDEKLSVQEMLPIIIQSAHSRFPVIGESRDEVVGILLAKDLLRYLVESNTDEFSIRDILRPAYMSPESKRLNVLLNEFRKSSNHMAIIVDEYGGVSGLVTIEDVLEQIVGDISDEHDLEEDQYITYSEEKHYALVKGLTPVEDFNEFFKVALAEADFDTIGGLITKQFGRVPKSGEKTQYKSLMFEVVRADSRRLHLLKVSHT